VLPPNADPPPEWFRDFLHYVGQRRLNAAGRVVEIRDGEWLALQERLRKVLHAERERRSPYLDVLRHFLRE
jgi:hypothetical protein